LDLPLSEGLGSTFCFRRDMLETAVPVGLDDLGYDNVIAVVPLCIAALGFEVLGVQGERLQAFETVPVVGGVPAFPIFSAPFFDSKESWCRICGCLDESVEFIELCVIGSGFPNE
jgi:hypothetical protein